jgi:hypothetical protein
VSLINDALKRAKHAQKGPAAPPARDPQLKPAEALPAKPSEWPVLMVMGILVVLVVSALVVTFVIVKRSHAALVAAPAPTPVAVAAAPPGPPSTAALPNPPVAPSASTTPAPAPAAVAPAQAAKPPLPRLQGIFFSLSRPWALVDGQTVLVGDHIGDFRVLAIARDRVTIARAGQTNVLSLAE